MNRDRYGTPYAANHYLGDLTMNLDICPDCGDFLSWCPEHPEFHGQR